jgi:hypothetical protein
MGEHEWLLLRLAQALSQVARPHRCDEAIPDEVHALLLQVGVPHSRRTPRKELIETLWARRRSLLGVTPPSAA